MTPRLIHRRQPQPSNAGHRVSQDHMSASFAGRNFFGGQSSVAANMPARCRSTASLIWSLTVSRPPSPFQAGCLDIQKQSCGPKRRRGEVVIRHTLLGRHRIDLVRFNIDRTDESCGFASQTSAMSGPPELLWPEASARGSRRALPQLGRRSSNHALHSRTLVQGRATPDLSLQRQGRQAKSLPYERHGRATRVIL